MSSDEIKQKLFDDLITYALEQEVEQRMSEMPSEEELKAKYHPSPELEKRMQKLFKGIEKQEKAARRNKVMKWAAACLVVMVGVSTVAINSVEAFRVRFYNTVYAAKEKYLDIRVEDKEKGSISSFEDQAYHPSYLPDGFYMVEEEVFLDNSQLLYENDEKVPIYISQFLIHEGATLVVDSEDAIMSTVMINGLKATICQKSYESSSDKIHTTIYWDDDIYFFKIISTLELEEVIKIAEGLKK